MNDRIVGSSVKRIVALGVAPKALKWMEGIREPRVLWIYDQPYRITNIFAASGTASPMYRPEPEQVNSQTSGTIVVYVWRENAGFTPEPERGAFTFHSQISDLPSYQPYEPLWNISYTESSTAQYENRSQLIEEFQNLFEAARDETFESGIETIFSRRLLALVKRYRGAAMEVLAAIIIAGSASSMVAAETLYWLARMNDPSTHRQRLELLESALAKASSARVRYSAGLGLGAMGDPRAIRPVKNALENETDEDVRRVLGMALSRLSER